MDPIKDTDINITVPIKTYFRTFLKYFHRIQIFHNHLQTSGFFSWTIGENDKNSSQHVIQIDQGGLTLPTRDYYLNKNDTTVIDALKRVIFKVVLLLIKDKDTFSGTSQTGLHIYISTTF